MLQTERRTVAEKAPSLAELTPGRTGNLSVRRDERIAITPTGVPYDEIDAADVPVVSLSGERTDGALEPSSETPMHTAVYREFEAGAIVHTHSPWASTLAILREPVPPVHYMVALAGREVPVAGYATYGTEELADNAVRAMEDAGSTACLLANHGLLATGETAADALEVAVNVEFTARIYCQARSIGDPTELSADELAAVEEKFAGYGQPESAE